MADRGGGAINVSRLLGASALRAGGVTQLPDVTAVPVGRVAGSAGGGVRVLVVASDVGGWAGVEGGNVTGCLGAVVATAAKRAPRATAAGASPGGSGSVQSALAAHDANGRKNTVAACTVDAGAAKSAPSSPSDPCVYP